MNDPVNNKDEAGSWSLPNWAKVTKVADSNLSAGSAMPSTLRRDKTQIWITENALENMQ